MEPNYKKSGKIHILIFPAGAENRMDIYDSLRRNRDFEIYGASSKRDHAISIYPADHYLIGLLNITEEQGLGILVISHNPELLNRICTRTVNMDKLSS